MNKIVLTTVILLALSMSIFAQTTEELQNDLKKCDCFVKAMKKYADINHNIWALAEYAPKSMTRGDEPIRIQHDCGPNNPTSGLYNHTQVINNIKKFEPECNRIRNQLGSSANDNQLGSSTSNNQLGSSANNNNDDATNITENHNKPLSEKNFGDIVIGDGLSNGIADFTNGLAGISDNPKVKRLANDINSIHKKYDDAIAFGSNFGPIDAETQGLLNFAQNIETVVAIGKAIFGKEPSLEERLSESQLAVRKHILKIGSNLRTMYDEVVAIEPYTNGGEEYLNLLENSEQLIEEYNALTVRERYFYLWYLAFDGYPDLQDYNNELNRIENLTVNQLLEKTGQLQNRFDMSKRMHIANKDIAFVGAMNLIKLNKMRYYKEIGRDDLVEQIKSSLTFDNVPIGETVGLLIETFNQKEYYATSRYAQIVQDHFQNEEIMYLSYENIPGLPDQYYGESEKGIDRGEISILMLLGVISAIETEQISLAQNNLEVLRQFHNNTVNWSERESKGGKKKKQQQENIKNRLEFDLEDSYAAKSTAEAYINIGLGNYTQALKSIEEASNYTTPIPTVFFLNLKILAYLGLENYDAAREVFRKWNGTSLAISQWMHANNGINFTDDKDRDFFNAFIRYHKKDYNGALIALELMKKKKTNQQPKVYLLEEKIYKSLNKEEEAKKAHHNYINSLN